MKKRLVIFLIILVLLIAGAGLAWWISNNLPSDQGGTPSTSTSDSGVAITDDLVITNEIFNFVDEGNNVFTITYKYNVRHAGNYPVRDVFIRSWFNQTPENDFSVVEVNSTNTTLQINPAFDGKADRNLILGAPTLPGNASFEMYVTIRLVYTDQTRQFVNYNEIGGRYFASSSSSRPASPRPTSSSPTTGPGTSAPVSSRPTSAPPVSSPSQGQLYDASQVTFVLPKAPVSSLPAIVPTTPQPELGIGKGG